MADDQAGTLPLLQSTLQPGYRFDIQVIGGLIQDEQVGLFQ